ncbi:hypothetical protein GOQ04_00935 [Emticicia sp. ODNR4P]|jgi:hypothetical protein|nr:hypothetical protein [Emticicia sp. ODNR4P]
MIHNLICTKDIILFKSVLIISIFAVAATLAVAQLNMATARVAATANLF